MAQRGPQGTSGAEQGTEPRSLTSVLGSFVLPAGPLAEQPLITLDFVPEKAFHAFMGRPPLCGLWDLLVNSSMRKAACRGQDFVVLFLLIRPFSPPECQPFEEQEETTELSSPNLFSYRLGN